MCQALMTVSSGIGVSSAHLISKFSRVKNKLYDVSDLSYIKRVVKLLVIFVIFREKFGQSDIRFFKS